MNNHYDLSHSCECRDVAISLYISFDATHDHSEAAWKAWIYATGYHIHVHDPVTMSRASWHTCPYVALFVTL